MCNLTKDCVNSCYEKNMRFRHEIFPLTWFRNDLLFFMHIIFWTNIGVLTLCVRDLFTYIFLKSGLPESNFVGLNNKWRKRKQVEGRWQKRGAEKYSSPGDFLPTKASSALHISHTVTTLIFWVHISWRRK